MTHEAKSFMAAKPSGRLISITGHLIGGKNSIPFVGRPLCFCCEEESFVFKELLELVYVCHRSMKWFHAVASFPKQVNKIRLLKVLFVKKLL